MRCDVTMRATLDATRFEGEDPDPEEVRGWVHPEPLYSVNLDSDLSEDEPIEVHYDDLNEAVEFVAEYPYGIWDLNIQCNDPILDHESLREGWDKRVNLHVSGPDTDRVLALAERRRARYDKARRAMLDKYLNR